MVTRVSGKDSNSGLRGALTQRGGTPESNFWGTGHDGRMGSSFSFVSSFSYSISSLLILLFYNFFVAVFCFSFLFLPIPFLAFSFLLFVLSHKQSLKHFYDLLCHTYFQKQYRMNSLLIKTPKWCQKWQREFTSERPFPFLLKISVYGIV